MEEERWVAVFNSQMVQYLACFPTLDGYFHGPKDSARQAWTEVLIALILLTR